MGKPTEKEVVDKMLSVMFKKKKNVGYPGDRYFLCTGFCRVFNILWLNSRKDRKSKFEDQIRKMYPNFFNWIYDVGISLDKDFGTPVNTSWYVPGSLERGLEFRVEKLKEYQKTLEVK